LVAAGVSVVGIFVARKTGNKSAEAAQKAADAAETSSGAAHKSADAATKAAAATTKAAAQLDVWPRGPLEVGRKSGEARLRRITVLFGTNIWSSADSIVLSTKFTAPRLNSGDHR
jgi:hypothetical protein